jgi:predicted O-methyltransferase YrrM
LPRAVGSVLAERLFGKSWPQPWIAYDAQAPLARHLGGRGRVLEFGSWMSTIWFARHAEEVVSIEDHSGWFARVEGMMKNAGLGNVRYRLAEEPADYCMPKEEERGGGFDLIMVDGLYRDRCIDTAIALVRPGGIIYLDNADRSNLHPRDGDMAEARRKLYAFAEAVGGTVQWFTDFAPGLLFVTGGLLVKAPDDLPAR